MFGSQIQTASLIVTGGAMAFALAVALWAYRLTEGARRSHKRWAERLKALEARLDRADGMLGAYPGFVMVWEEEAVENPGDWGAPKLYGSPTALASMLRLCDLSDGPDIAARLLDGLADYEARDAAGGDTTLRAALAALRADGAPFSMTITGPAGRFLEADGRPAGRRVVLWVADATIKGIEQSSALGKIEEVRQLIAREPEAFLDMLSKAPFPVWRLSSGLKLQWANKAYLDAVGAEGLDDATNRDVTFDPEIKEQAREALFQRGRIDAVRAVVAAGERRHYAISVFPVSGGATAIAIDTTRAVEAREELERNVRAQEEALNRLDEAVAIFDSEQRLAFHNDAFAKFFKLEPAWLERHPGHGALLDNLRENRLLPDQANADYADWKQNELAHYADLRASGLAEAWRLPDERILRVTRLRHPLGGLLLIFSDITEKVTLEGRYNTLIRVQRATLDKLTEGVAVFGSDGRLRLVNSAFAEIWGLEPDLLCEGMSFDELIAQCMARFHDRAAWEAMKARVTDANPDVRQPVEGEWELSSVDRTLTYVSRPLPSGDTLIAFSDVTAQRTLAAALSERAAAFETADRVKSEFVGHVSYQLRAPLQTILGYSELVKRTLGPELREKEAGQLSSILTAAKDLYKLVEDILDIAAIEAGTIELDLARMEIKPALESAVNLLQVIASEQQVRVSVDCGASVGAITADAKRIKQVVYNLLLNALQHSEAGEAVEVGATREGAGVALWVSDEGAGISPAEQGRVFEAWQHGRRGGAGLGLALVREFVEMHGGWVDLVSEPGKGTRVTCHLPETPPDTISLTAREAADA